MKRTRRVTDEWEVRQRKLEFAKEAYAEVLDATKHQDDKVGRYLAALAFLTTGAIALLLGEGILARDFGWGATFRLKVTFRLSQSPRWPSLRAFCSRLVCCSYA